MDAPFCTLIQDVGRLKGREMAEVVYKKASIQQAWRTRAGVQLRPPLREEGTPSHGPGAWSNR